MDLFVHFDFAAARHLPNLPADHPCARQHGHTFQVEITVSGKIDPQSGWIADFDDIEGAIDGVKQRLDHRCLNDISGLDNPTTEVLASWIWRELANELPAMSQIKVQEHPTRGVIYRGEEHGTA